MKRLVTASGLLIATLLCAATPTVAKDKDDSLAAFTTAPGAGIAAARQVAIARTLGKRRYDTFSGIWKIRGAKTWVLLDDGTAVEALGVVPSRIDLDALRKAKPESLRRAGDIEGAVRHDAVPKGTPLDMTLSRRSVGGTRGMISSSTRRWTFRPDGRFERSVFTLVSADSPGGETSTTIAKTEGKEGTSSTLSGTAKTGTGTVSTKATQAPSGTDPSMAGRYAIEGVEIELTYDDGRTERLLFAGSGDDFYIGDAVYSR